jgi:hypothetical protein
MMIREVHRKPRGGSVPVSLIGPVMPETDHFRKMHAEGSTCAGSGIAACL